jgi:hypothetical protein
MHAHTLRIGVMCYFSGRLGLNTLGLRASGHLNRQISPQIQYAEERWEPDQGIVRAATHKLNAMCMGFVECLLHTHLSELRAQDDESGPENPITCCSQFVCLGQSPQDSNFCLD